MKSQINRIGTMLGLPAEIIAHPGVLELVKGVVAERAPVPGYHGPSWNAGVAWARAQPSQEPMVIIRISQLGSTRTTDVDFADCVRSWPDGEYKLHAQQTEADQRGPTCNPHPKAPHGFSRNASHDNGAYVCECQSWDPYDAGHNEGFHEGLKFGEQEGQPDVGADQRDAARYRWLRSQHWESSRVCVVTHPKKNVRLGTICPSGDALDKIVDEGLATP